MLEPTGAAAASAPRGAGAPTRSVAGAGILGGGLEGVAVALIALQLFTFAVRNAPLQWDLDSYLLAARAARAGMDPYRLENLSSLAGHPVGFPFVYPPLALLPFLALAALPAATAAAVWIGAKLVLLAGLVVVWKRRFVPHAGWLAVALIAVFGWNAAALWDLRAGNVALVESALLWAGFACFVAGRRAAFAGLVVAAAMFKLVPAAYLLLLLVPTAGQRPRPRLLVTSAIALAVLAWGPLALGPAVHWRGFIANLPDATQLGAANPSALALATTVAGSLGATGANAARLGIGLWAAFGLALLALSLPLLRGAWRSADACRWVMVAVFLDLLLAPRPMAYGFVRLAPVPLFFAPLLSRRPGTALLVATAFSAQGLARCANQQPDSALLLYSPFLLTLFVWVLVLAATRMAERGDLSPIGAPTAG